MKTMIVDTSSSTASVAIFNQQVLIGEFLLNTPNTHSQKLMPLIESLLTMLHLKIKEFDLIIACEGPGSFTGVRIGLSTVKAFSQPFNIPLITETSLAMLASGLRYFDGIIVPIIDAKRSDVYFGEMTWEKGGLVKINEDVMALPDLLEYIKETYPNRKIMFVGDATEIYLEMIETFIENHKCANMFISDPSANIPKASNLAYLINSDHKTLNYHEVKANYMRKSQAERDLK